LYLTAASLYLSLPIKNLAAFLLEFSSLRRARKRVPAEYLKGNLLERQLGVFEAVVIELNPRSRLGSGQSHSLGFLFHSGECITLPKADDEAGKPNMGTEFWADVYTKKSMERAAHILDLIDAKWPAGELDVR
jgi:hypothetical protein